MADRIRIQTEQMEELLIQMKALSSAFDILENEIRSVHMDRISGAELKIQLPSGILSSIGHGFRSGKTTDCLQSIAGNLSEMSQYAQMLAGGIGKVTDLFEDNERSLENRFGSLNIGERSLFESACGVLNYSTDRSKWSPDMHRNFQQMINDGRLVIAGGMGMILCEGVQHIFDHQGLLATFEEKSGITGVTQTIKGYSGSRKAEITSEYGFLTTGAKYENDILKPGNLGDPIKKYYDKDGNEIEYKEKKLGNKMELLSVGHTVGSSVSAWHQEGLLEGENGKLEGSIGIGNAGAHATGVVGFGTYLPGENGESELYLGASGEMGVSVSALDMKGTAEYELCDFVEVSAEGDVSVLAANAGVSGGIGIIGGEFVAHAKASAEANLVEANAEGSLDVAGVKGTVGAGVQVGVGVKAEVGYNEGVIVLDVGATLGVGVSINAELDISGAIDYVGDALQPLAEGFESFCAWWG